MGAVVAVTVMRVLSFVLHVCMLRGCEVAGNAGVGVVSEGHVGASGIVSSAADLLWMRVVHGMREVGGVCEMC